MSARVQDVFEPGVELTHIYDFGTSSVTLIKAVRVRQGIPLTPDPIFLMARNSPFHVHCQECGQLAAWFCRDCGDEPGEVAFFCRQHALEHDGVHYEGMMALVNSPREGMCGYSGPSEPPY
jgi:hypothetical protein